MKSFLLLIFFLFTSCSHSVNINPKGCYSKGQIVPLKLEKHTFETKIYTFGSHSEKYLEEILESKKISCKKIKNINYAFKTDIIDSIVSVVPFIEMKTLVVNYTLE